MTHDIGAMPGRRVRTTILAALALAAVAVAPAAAQPARARPVVVASKPFGESYLLAELFAQWLEAGGRRVDRRPGLGATEVAFAALRTDAIDVYPEYVGTGLVAILGDSVTAAMRADPRVAFAHVARASVARFGVQWLPPLGFQNGYAIAVRRETAGRFALRTLSDLARAPVRLTGGFTSDFIGRADGWPGLQRTYGLRLAAVRPLAPALKYDALAAGAVDVIDGYATDGRLATADLVVLADDARAFPPYEAAAIVSPRLAREDADAVARLAQLSGRFTEAQLRAWNRAIEVEGRPVADVAREALATVMGDAAPAARPSATDRATPRASTWSVLRERRLETLRLLGQHVRLVALALGAAIAVALPLGLWLAGRPAVGALVLQGLGVVQTIPGLAFLALLIPLAGIGAVPALVALFAYALLPIVRATVTGLRLADPEAVAAIEAMGATPTQALRWVRLPLALPVVLSGVRTAAVLTVGTATLAAFVGAGGLGEPIVTGLGLADMRLVLSGAIPAALLAVAVDGLLALVERLATPPHLRPARG